ncbi:hypothetical protein LSAT2_031799 [Lamellibrachia satsuma]|nr:hypothetical protein LSAT2_031799 [Lamellibrachia satsuma]
MGETSDVNIPELTKGQEYHAFITHNSESEGKVSRSLYTALTDKGFKCCHADINFTPGIPIVTNIIMAVNASRRVIAIVSPEFLKSDWCLFETISTLNESNDRGRQVMIPVLYNMDPELLPAYMKSMTYLENTDKNFMVKLTRAISLHVPLAASIPAGNVAHGLAWSYFYGFLNLVLPNLDERVKKSKYWSHQPKALQQAGNEGQESDKSPDD